ncbi:hypothetical protein HR060_05455 [Catenovulum sp. SM1970]|uniref:hypothetical protein n=1 Tax=Marinifaba aquimaris TaxID=2741323 RepID=UPI0015721650|nr:hypothetical protein [Marinifaba aquimaris]NTS76310.1 hypothetical protein [Marinifaba aquimaris]
MATQAQFNTSKLMAMTIILSALGAISILFVELTLVFSVTAGFFYSFILWTALNKKPTLMATLAVSIILGLTHGLSIYFAEQHQLIARLTEYGFMVIPSLLGAVLSLLCLNKIWQLKLPPYNQGLILLLIALSSLIYSWVSYLLSYSADSKGSTVIINCILWWLAFSSGLSQTSNYAGDVKPATQ